METKHIIFLAAVAAGVPLLAAVASSSRPVRDAIMFIIILLTIFMETLSINFLDQAAYRGTARGIEITAMDLLALALLLGVLLSGRNGRWYTPGSFWLMVVFLLYCAASVAMHDPRIFGTYEIARIIRGIIMFLAVAMYVRSERELRVVVLALAVTVIYLGAVAFHQRYFLGRVRVDATLLHPNNLSMYCCIAGPLLVSVSMANVSTVYRLLAAIGAMAAGGAAILSISRTGVAVFMLVSAAAFLSCLRGRLTGRQAAAIALAVLVAGGALARSWDTVMGRVAGRSLAHEFVESEKGRGMYFRLGSMVVQDHFFGVGLNNWSYVVTDQYYPRLGLESAPYPEDIGSLTDILSHTYTTAEMRHQIAPPAHNLGVLVIGELGVPGFILFWLIWARWYQMALSFWRERSAILMSRYAIGAMWAITGCFLHNLTEYAYRQTPVYMIMHIVVGALAAVYHAKQTQVPVKTRQHREQPEYLSGDTDSTATSPGPPRKRPRAVYR